MVFQPKKHFKIGSLIGSTAELSELSEDEIRYIQVCLQNSVTSDHPEAKHGAHPEVVRYFEHLLRERPERALELLITQGRSSVQLGQELIRQRSEFAREWYAEQAPEVRTRVDAKLALRPDLPPGLMLYDAVCAVREEMKLSQKLKIVPPGMSASS